MEVIGVIPARYASSRLPGKVLLDILGKPMLQHVWERAKKSRLLDELLIACDDERVLAAARKFGAKAVMTSVDHASGTDRIAEAMKGRPADIIINIQGDEPLIAPSVIDALAKALLKDEHCPMATVIKPVAFSEELENPNVVKVVVDARGYALYFSRSLVPFPRAKVSADFKFYKHLGIYAYRKDFLMKFKKLPASALEKAERLEQLRVLEAGFHIRTVETDMDTIGVDTAEDLKKVEAHMRGNR